MTSDIDDGAVSPAVCQSIKEMEREIAWTEEMFRIYEASPGEFEPSWDSMLAQCKAESRDAIHQQEQYGESAENAIGLGGKRLWSKAAHQNSDEFKKARHVDFCANSQVRCATKPKKEIFVKRLFGKCEMMFAQLSAQM